MHPNGNLHCTLQGLPPNQWPVWSFGRVSTPMDKAARSLELPRTAASNYRQGRGRPASSSAPRRATASDWTSTREDELEHHAALIPRAFAEPVPRAIGLESYKHRDLLASHARRVSTAAQKRRTDEESAVLASSVVRWQLEHRDLASRAAQSRRSAGASASSSRPNTAAGFVHYVPETPAEDRMNARWQQHREEEIVMARNDLAVKRALAQWAAQKQQLEQEITRRIENRRRPLSATTARGLHFSRGIQGIIEPPNTAGLQDTLHAVQTHHLDTDSEPEDGSQSDQDESGAKGGARSQDEQKASAAGFQSRATSQAWRGSKNTPTEQVPAWRPTGTAPAGASRGGSAARRTRFSPQAVRPVTAATVASMGSVGTSDTSAAQHRQRLRVPVLVPRSRGVATDEEEAAMSLGMTQGTPSMGGTWAGAASAGGVRVNTAGGAMAWPNVPADAGLGAGNRPPARAIATPMFRGRGEATGDTAEPAAVSLPGPPAEGGSSLKSKGGSPRAKKASRGGGFGKNEGPPPKYDQRVAKQDWGAGMRTVVPRAPTPSSLTPLELAMSRQAARDATQQGPSDLEAEVDSALQVFRSKGFAVTRKTVERAILMTPGEVKPIDADYGLMRLRTADAEARSGSAAAGATRGGSSRGSSRPGTATTSAKGGKGGKSSKPKKLPFVSYGLHQMDVSSAGPTVAAASRFLPDNPLEDLAQALAVSWLYCALLPCLLCLCVCSVL